MSAKPEVHYWASGMPRKEAQLYLLDLCGSESQSYTEREEEVTCERCLAALRAGTGPAAPRAAEGAASAVVAAPAVDLDPNGVLDRAVRAAVLKEREEIARLFDGRPDHDEVDAWVAARIRERA